MYTINKNTWFYGLDKTGLTVEEVAELLRDHEKLSRLKYYYFLPYTQGGTGVIQGKKGNDISVEFYAENNCYTSLMFN